MMTYLEMLFDCLYRRVRGYPSIGDQLDALYKARQGDPAPLQAIDARIAAVKAAYPKPVDGA